MYSQQEHRARLQQQAENILFEAEFQKEVERQIAGKQAQQVGTLAERLGVQAKQAVNPYTKFAIEGDDEHKTLMFKSFLKDCAFYFDSPSIQDENKMRSTLQRKYDGILSENWRAPLTTRRDLLTWACNQTNASFEAKGIAQNDLLKCDNYHGLLSAFGPDYNNLKSKLGFVRGLFD